MRAVVLACLSACGFHAVAASSPGDSGGDVPGSADAAIDATPDGSTTVDTDGDGVVDASDNCPTIANADQRDWDGDHHGDVCDHCPHLASATDPDGDGDGVGDACDPRPTMGGDTRVLWDGFYDANDITGWLDGGTGGIGSWAVTGGKLVQSATDPLNFTSFYGPGTWQKTYVAASFVVGSWNTGATLGVCSGWNGQHFDCCNINIANSSSGASVGEAQQDLTQKADTALPTIATGQTFDVVQNLVSTNACSFNTTAMASAQPFGQAGHVIFYAGHSSASFRYLFVVTIGA